MFYEIKEKSELEQLDLVYDYMMNRYKTYTRGKKELRDWKIEDFYLAVWSPAYICSDLEVFTKKTNKKYMQNPGLDFNEDGKITRTDIRERMREMYKKGKLNKG